jgi:two-component system, NarL family, nitrate/nitrite response regulator NarL
MWRAAMTRVLILSEVGVHREALAEFVSRDGDGRVEVVGVAADLEEAVAALEDGEPDIVLVDMPNRTGPNAVRTLVAAAPEIEVVALAVPEVERDVIAFAEAGASGYVTREGSMDDLVAVVDSVARGEASSRPRSRRRCFAAWARWHASASWTRSRADSQRASSTSCA